MKQGTSAYLMAQLAAGLAVAELPLEDRSDRWWSEFWFFIGFNEAQRARENLRI